MEEAQKHKDIFIAQMSHEMRTPMNAICGISDLLLEKNFMNDTKLFSTLSKSSKQLLNIINDILDVSRLQTGKFRMQSITYLLDELLEDVYMTIKKDSDEKGLFFDFSINAVENIYINGDPYRLKQILNNILSNAIKFTSIGNINFKVNVSKLEKIIYFDIEDTGIGMSNEELDKIFIPFSQANNSIHLNYGGTGIGLNISKKLLDLFNGNIQIKSEIGVGTSVSIKFPIEIVAKADESKFENKEIVSKEIKNYLRGAKILLAEDNNVNRIIFKELIKSEIPSIIIDSAINGEEVIEKIEVNEYDLIIMDIQMPKMNGLQTTKIIRSHKSDKINDIIIIALSAYARKSEIDECLNIGMNDYLSKPLNKNELLLKMYNLLSSRRKVIV